MALFYFKYELYNLDDLVIYLSKEIFWVKEDTINSYTLTVDVIRTVPVWPVILPKNRWSNLSIFIQ